MNNIIYDSIDHTSLVLHKYPNICVMVSGGSDSDIMIDLIEKYKDIDNSVDYVFFNTGVEFKHTLAHLDYLESKYNIKIHRVVPQVTIPKAVKLDGYPFLSKYVSEMIDRLQRHNFDFANPPETFENAYKLHPKCKIGLKWFYNCNDNVTSKKGKELISAFNIARNKRLREFLIKYPPPFKISNKCCKHAKKDISKEWLKNNKYDVVVLGIRKSEGGVRSSAYKSCFDKSKDIVNYRPIFWYKDSDKQEYKQENNIKYSDLYEKHDFKRTGCSCCPYGKNYNWELEFTKVADKQLYKAVNNIFGEVYEYTNKYIEFKGDKESE